MFVYYVDGERYTTDNDNIIPRNIISSPDENTPAYEKINGPKVWCEKGYIWHRLTGPAFISPNGTELFFLNDWRYKNIHDWLKAHSNQDNAFQIEMLLKYT
jgi:hypothetical protein